ncbi:hypothetical protein JRO89_XS14G0076000 [Xanthoceras sorbifolium]|uniref:ADP,ATP carrier protein n=1 Tax=Xanthoceras sorbifolium TaxID=99658 RepID=A0ABQ8H4B8_9ROSI|nr:hypothetical protein JRO89_XS14G0076000 [Xanthoceras sorbifolium]
MQTEARVGVVVEGEEDRELLAGGVAGALSKTCTAPLLASPFSFRLVYGVRLRELCGEEGFRAFWKGNLVQLLIVYLILLSTFMHMSTTTKGGLAGITAASATYPLDLVRTRLAAQVR